MGKLIRRRIDLDPLMFSTMNVRRTPGIHLTEVLRDILMTSGVMKKQKDESKGGFTEAQLKKFQLQGYLWEDIYCEKLAERLGRVGEYQRIPEIAFNPITGYAFWVTYAEDGTLLTPIPPGYIVCSPDGMRIHETGVSLAEFKWTTKSAKMDPEQDKPEWFFQVKGYLGALSAALDFPVRRVEWHVQFPVGEYWGDPCIYEEWEKEFSDREVADCWSMTWGHIQDVVKRNPQHKWKEFI